MQTANRATSCSPTSTPTCPVSRADVPAQHKGVLLAHCLLALRLSYGPANTCWLHRKTRCILSYASLNESCQEFSPDIIMRECMEIAEVHTKAKCLSLSSVASHCCTRRWWQPVCRTVTAPQGLPHQVHHQGKQVNDNSECRFALNKLDQLLEIISARSPCSCYSAYVSVHTSSVCMPLGPSIVSCVCLCSCLPIHLSGIHSVQHLHISQLL